MTEQSCKEEILYIVIMIDNNGENVYDVVYVGNDESKAELIMSIPVNDGYVSFDMEKWQNGKKIVEPEEENLEVIE